MRCGPQLRIWGWQVGLRVRLPRAACRLTFSPWAMRSSPDCSRTAEWMTGRSWTTAGKAATLCLTSLSRVSLRRRAFESGSIASMARLHIRAPGPCRLEAVSTSSPAASQHRVRRRLAYGMRRCHHHHGLCRMQVDLIDCAKRFTSSVDGGLPCCAWLLVIRNHVRNVIQARRPAWRPGDYPGDRRPPAGV